MQKIVLFFLLYLFSSVCPVFAQEETTDLYIEIVVEERMLYFYEKHSENLLFLEAYPIASFRQGLPEYPLGLGYATKVEFNPVWYPTDYSVEYMNKKLEKAGKAPRYTKGEAIRHGDPRNAMGKFKIHLSHRTKNKGNVFRIHGTNDRTSIGKRVSGGCTRMDDSKSEVIDFAKKINLALKSGHIVEVNITMKKSSI